MTEKQDADLEWDAAWLDELDSRVDDVAADPAQLDPWEAVRDRLLAELQQQA